MIEEWRTIVGYEGLYEVSNTGQVRSLDKYDSINRFRKGRILTLYTETGGYLKVGLSSNGKTKKYLVHRLVAEAFIPNPDNLPQVNHIDENPSNDNVDNLEWCNAKYNSNYGTRNDRIRNSRIRERDTKIQKGLWTGLSRKEYRKQYVENNRDKIREINRRYYLKRKMIQNNVKSLNDQV